MSRGPWLTAAFKAQMWRRWQAGESCTEIAQGLGKRVAQVYTLLAQRGGGALVPVWDLLPRRRRGRLCLARRGILTAPAGRWVYQSSSVRTCASHRLFVRSRRIPLRTFADRITRRAPQ
jgi:hypothetical protein